MKQYICIAMALLLMTGVFTGCGCQNVSQREDGMITDPTGLIPSMTTDPTRDTTQPSIDSTDGTEPSRPAESTKPTTDFSRAPENVNGGTTYWMDPKESTGETTGSTPTDATELPRSRGHMNGSR